MMEIDISCYGRKETQGALNGLQVATTVSCLVEKNKFLVALWASISQPFEGYSVEQITLHWKELALSYAGP